MGSASGLRPMANSNQISVDMKLYIGAPSAPMLGLGPPQKHLAGRVGRILICWVSKLSLAQRGCYI